MWHAIKTLFAMGLPMVSTRLAQTIRGFILMVMLAQLGHTVLAASLFISIFQIVLMLIFMSPLFAVGSIVGRQYGEKKYESLAPILQQSCLISVLLGIPIMLIFSWIGPIMQLLHQPANIIPYVTTFLHILAWAIPGIMLSVAMQQFVAGIKLQRIVTWLMLFSLVLSAFLAYGLIFGHFGLPRMGVAGGALAMVIRAWATTVIYLFIMVWIHRRKVKIWPLHLKGHWHWSKLMLKIGMPICFQLSSEMLALTLYAVMVGWLGEIALGASQIASEYMMFAIVPVFGLAEANGIVVGHSYGEKRFAEIKKLGIAGILGAACITGGIALIFIIFHRPLADVFIHFDQPDAQAIYYLALWILGLRIISMLFDGTVDVITGALRGLYDTKFPMYLSMAMHWLFALPLAAILGFGLHLGVIGLVLGGLAGNLLSASVLTWRWHHKSTHLPMAQAGAA